MANAAIKQAQSAMLNVRMPKELKTCGEEVLRANGLNATTAVRVLYEQLAKTQEVPEWMNTSNAHTAVKKRQTLRKVAGCAPLEKGKTLQDLKRERLSKKV